MRRLVVLGIAAIVTGLIVQAVLIAVVGLVIGAVGLIWWAWRTAETP